jgi:hypothetical protein
MVTLVSACTVVSGRGRLPCPRSRILVPACGVIWGAATAPHTLAKLVSVESALGRRFDMTYRFHDLDDVIPTEDERKLVAGNRILHVSIDAKLHSDAQQTITWASVAAGAYDQTLAAQARGIATLRVPVFVTFDHEPDQVQNSDKGSPSDFVAAWRHVHELFQHNGAGNAVWVWVVTGYEQTFSAAGRMWPGDDSVDWISWEAYNAAGCRTGRPDPAQTQTFAESALGMFDWLMQNGSRYGIDTSKPMMISEAASVVFGSDAALSAAWYQQIPTVLRTHPQIRAIGLWDRPGNGSCRYQFDGLDPISRAVSRAGLTAPIWPY